MKIKLLRITEINTWERERWSYVLTLEKRSSEALNSLMTFIASANKYFDDSYENAPECRDFMGRGYKVAACSRYTINFYDSIELGGKYPALVSGKSKLHLNGGGNYKSGGIYLDEIISPKRIKLAKNKMVEKQDNVIYKNFESLFLKQTKQVSTSHTGEWYD